MNTPHLSRAIDAWRDALGPDTVCTDADMLRQASANVTGFSRSIPCVLRPASTEDVRTLVRLAREHHAAIHPISCGCNWGLGSRLPARDGCALLDLSRMNRIRDLSSAGLYAEIEAGVSQGQLADEIAARDLPLMVNVTGSSRSSSLVGNALERGIGYFAGRADELSSLEIVTGTGRILRTGFGDSPFRTMAHRYRYGIGPSLDGLFAQSGLGVVTAAGVSLLPRPPAHAAAILKIRREAELPLLIDFLMQAKRDGLITTVAHVGDRARTEISIGPRLIRALQARNGPCSGPPRQTVRRIMDRFNFGPWSAVVGLFGTSRGNAAARRDLRKRLPRAIDVSFVSEAKIRRAQQLLRPFAPHSSLAAEQLALLEAILPLHNLSRGIPTDVPLDSVLFPVEGIAQQTPANPDTTRSGMIYVLPFLPADGESARRVVELARSTASEYGFTPYITLNTIDLRCLEAVINIAFDRDDGQQVETAHHCADRMLDRLMAAGFPPYRVPIGHMDRVVDPDTAFWQTVADLKEVFDPDRVISPGRYDPTR